MKEQLFEVNIQHKTTGNKVKLHVWAENVQKATWELGGVIGPNTEYRWTGSGPVYKNNKVVTRDTRELP